MREELGGLQRALERGTKLSALRVVRVVCPAGHTVADVFRADDGHLWVSAVVFGSHVRHVTPRTRNGNRIAHVRALAATSEVLADCRCPRPNAQVKSSTPWRVPASAISEAAAEGVRRLVISPAWRAR